MRFQRLIVIGLTVLVWALAGCMPGAQQAASDAAQQATAGSGPGLPGGPAMFEPTATALAALVGGDVAPTVAVAPTLEPATPSVAEAPTESSSGPRFEGPTDVTISAPDGTALAATVYPTDADGAPVAILLHQLGSDREAWAQAGFTELLNGAGIAAVAVDMRGHGDTGGAQDWESARTDVSAVVEYLADLPQVDVTRVILIGASIGSTMVLQAAGEVDGVQAVVALSPGLAYRDLLTEPAIVAFDAPVLLVTGERDSYSLAAVERLGEVAGERATEWVFADDSRHGTVLFFSQPTLAEDIVNWLLAALN